MLHYDLDFKTSCAKSFRTSTGLVNKSIHPKVKSMQEELGENKMLSGIVLQRCVLVERVLQYDLGQAQGRLGGKRPDVSSHPFLQ